MVRLKHASLITGCEIFAKCEFENPGGSIKDRAALGMVQDAEATGVLVRGEPATLVEGTAGNTGIGLAILAKTLGYRCVICIADTQSTEKIALLQAYGAELIQVPAVPFRDRNNYVHVAKRIAEELISRNHRAFYVNQWDNLNNRRSHYETTGPEILKQFGGKIDAFNCAIGTGGTLTGVGQFLRENHPNVKIALTDPKGGALYRYFRDGKLNHEGSSISEGIGQGRVTGNIQGFTPDMLFEINDIEMINVLNDLQQHDGLILGGSSGINVAGAIRVAKELGPGHTIVTILCDLGNRYSSKLHNYKFLASKGLPIAPWLQTESEKKRTDSIYHSLLIESHDAAMIA